MTIGSLNRFPGLTPVPAIVPTTIPAPPVPAPPVPTPVPAVNLSQ